MGGGITQCWGQLNFLPNPGGLNQDSPNMQKGEEEEEGPAAQQDLQAGESDPALQEDTWPLDRCPTRVGPGLL